MFIDIGKTAYDFEDEEFQRLSRRYFAKFMIEKQEKEQKTSQWKKEPILNKIYPESDTEHINNIRFYKGEIESKPRGAKIHAIHKQWFGNWKLLEEHHGVYL